MNTNESASAGHWRFNSIPTHLNNNGPFFQWFRKLAPQAGNAGSTPARVNDRQDQVVQLADTRRLKRCAPCGHGSSILPLVIGDT